jgi:uncharacterized protein YjbI with pentapeptide repeats
MAVWSSMTEPTATPWAEDVEEHRRWIDSDGAEGASVSWFGEDVSGVDLKGAVLAEATLIETNLSGAVLEKADLSRVTAGGSRFDSAHLAEATFVKAELSGANFECASASAARFEKSTLRDASFERAVLRGAKFDQASAVRSRFVGADLRETSWWKTTLQGADLSGTDLHGARFADTQVDVATRFDGALGMAEMRIESILVNGRRLEGKDARAWIETQSTRPAWTVEFLELWMLAKMRGPRTEAALHLLKRSTADMIDIAELVGAVLDKPGAAAAEYQRILRTPRATRLVTATGTFAGSFRHEYLLPLWPDVVFVVNEHPDGYAWGIGFEGGPAELPADPQSIEPWRWTAERLRREAMNVEVLEEWNFDLEANLTFPNGQRFHARFDLGLLQTWEPATQ